MRDAAAAVPCLKTTWVCQFSAAGSSAPDMLSPRKPAVARRLVPCRSRFCGLPRVLLISMCTVWLVMLSLFSGSALTRLRGGGAAHSTAPSAMSHGGRIISSPLSSERYILLQGTRHALSDCGVCGSAFDVCTLLPHSWVFDLDAFPLGVAFDCTDTPLLMRAYMESSGHSFAGPALMKGSTDQLYFYQNATVVKLTTCADCGPLYGSLCDGRIPHVDVPDSVLARMGSPADDVFVCHRHFSGMVQPLPHRTWTIMTPPHVLLLASLMADALRQNSFDVEVVMAEPETYNRDIYIVISVHVFEQLPPPAKRFVVQLEQQSSNWFTERNVAAMRESLAVLEYNYNNIEYLASLGVKSNVWYMPLGGNPRLSVTSSVKEYDVLFYGDLRSPRRTAMLAALTERCQCRVKSVSEMFGEGMHDLIRKARFVVNIHLFVPSQLEVYRIHEALSLGVPVISEDAPDRHMYPELAPAVRYFDFNSTESMLAVVLRELAARTDYSQSVREVVQKTHARFQFNFNRVLFGRSLVPITSQVLFTHAVSFAMPQSIAEPVILSVPESFDRRNQFVKSTVVRTGLLFDGIRQLYRPTWMSCALSYMTLSKLALNAGLRQLTVAEDDVVFPRSFASRMAIVEEYLASLNGEWDLFSGLIADVHPSTKVLDVRVEKGMYFLTIDKMTSTVFNVYNHKVLKLLAAWDPEDGNVVTNTIDRYIERQTSLRVVVTLPYLVQHREDAASTLWGFQNTEYVKLISRSQQLLTQKLSDFVFERDEKRKRSTVSVGAGIGVTV